MTGHYVNNNTRMGLVISLCSNSNHFVNLIPPKLPQILDIYSVVALQLLCLQNYDAEKRKKTLSFLTFVA